MDNNNVLQKEYHTRSRRINAAIDLIDRCKFDINPRQSQSRLASILKTTGRGIGKFACVYGMQKHFRRQFRYTFGMSADPLFDEPSLLEVGLMLGGELLYYRCSEPKQKSSTDI